FIFIPFCILGVFFVHLISVFLTYINLYNALYLIYFMKKRGQVSLEYLSIFSFAMLLTLTLVSIYFLQQNNIQADITSAKVTRISNEIVSAAHEVYYIGYPSQKTLEFDFPKGIEQIIITNQGISFSVN